MKHSTCRRLVWMVAGAWLVLIGSTEAPLRAQDYAPAGSGAVDHYDVDALYDSARSRLPFALDAAGKRYTVEVSAHDLRAPDFKAAAWSSGGRREIIPAPPRTFRGRVAGDPESVVRLSFGQRGISAYLRTGDDEVFIEPLAEREGRFAAAPDDFGAHVAFAIEDLDVDGTCAAPEDAARAARALRAKIDSGDELPAPAEGDLQALQIAVHADFEFFERHGTATPAVIEEILNVVEGIYESELGITIEITALDYFEENVDPYTALDALDLLGQLQQHWNSTQASVERDVVHLFTGKDLDGTTVGIAFVGEVCDLAGAYGLSQHLPSGSLMPLLVAHEIGHNLGAFHDDSGSEPRFIMHPVLSGMTLDEFSDLSVTDIGDYVASVSCLAVEPAGDGGDGGSDSGVDGGSGSAPPQESGGGGPIDPFLLVIAGLAACACRKKHARER